MSLLSKLASFMPGNTAAKVAGDIFDKDGGLLKSVGGYINDLNLTDEERLKYAQQAADAAAQFAKDTMSENTERSKARRTIATEWIRVQLVMLLMTFCMTAWDKEKAIALYQVATSDIMFYGTLAVMGFHFGGYYLKSGIPGLKLSAGKNPDKGTP